MKLKTNSFVVLQFVEKQVGWISNGLKKVLQVTSIDSSDLLRAGTGT